MPTLNPGDTGYKPADWRIVWDAYASLVRIVRKYKGNTTGWHLQFPSRAKKIVDPRWQLTFTSIGQKHLTTIWLGSNGVEAANTIKKMLPYYQDYYQSLITVQTKTTKKPSPLRDDLEMVRLKDALQAERNGRRLLTDRQKWLADRKAGHLDMSVRRYLTSHPHALMFPTPPFSQKEVEERHQQYRKIMEQVEKDRREGEDRPDPWGNQAVAWDPYAWQK
jgi:hypothetical protein